MDDWSTIPNRNADREPAPNPTRPLNPDPTRPLNPDPNPANRAGPHHCQTQPAASSATNRRPSTPAVNQALDPPGLARPHHTEPRGKAPKPLYPPSKPTVTRHQRPQNDADLEPPLDITRPFMDDKLPPISVIHAPLAGRTRNG
jgi:hypothetical protein